MVRETSLAEFQEVWDLLGLSWEHITGEAFFHDHGEAVEARLRDAGLLEESEGALVVRLPDEPVPFMVRKSDGASLYGTRDLAAALYRREEYGLDRMLYVTDQGQGDYFRRRVAYPLSCHGLAGVSA